MTAEVYHSLEDIEALLRSTSGRGLDLAKGQPIPTEEIEHHMAQTELSVEAQISIRYKVPVEDKRGKGILKYVCSRLTAATLWRIMQGTTISGPSDKAIEWEEQANSLLEKITSGQMRLGNAELISQDALGADVEKKDVPRIWHIDEVQW